MSQLKVLFVFDVHRPGIHVRYMCIGRYACIGSTDQSNTHKNKIVRLLSDRVLTANFYVRLVLCSKNGEL